MNTFSTQPIEGAIIRDRSEFMNKVFLTFAFILAIATLGAYGGIVFYSSNIQMLGSPVLTWGPFLMLLGLTFTMHVWGQKAPLNFALGSLTAALCGFITTPLLLVAIGVGGLFLPVKALIVSVCVFTAAAMMGWITKKDMSTWGGMLSISVLAIIVTSLVNVFFLRSTVMSMVIDSVMILVFTLFTAYDVQSIKERYPDNMAMTAALSLFLDFLNLFQSILHLLISLQRD